MNKYNVIVVGLGAMGSAALYQLSQRGVRVLGIDQYDPPHALGSSHGDTRFTRQAIGEGNAYVPLVLRSNEIFEAIERKTGKKLLERVGGLIFGNAEADAIHGKKNFVQATIEAAEQFNIKHQVLNAREISERFPQFILSGSEVGYFEEGAGFLRPEVCIETQLALAKENGAHVLVNTKVLSVEPQDDGSVCVSTEKETYFADKAILTTGAWMQTFFTEMKHLFKVYRQVLHWFDCSRDYEQFTPAKFPVFTWDFGNGKDIYGFPAIDGRDGGIKIASEEYESESSPDSVDRVVGPDEAVNMYERYIKGKVRGVLPSIVKSKVCMYTVTPDSDFILDIHPKHRQIVIASPCSGHGFKHSAAIGEVLADLATKGETEFDIAPFSIKRFL